MPRAPLTLGLLMTWRLIHAVLTVGTLLVVLATTISPVHAVPVTVEFAATITRVQLGDDIFSVGDQLIGAFTYETDSVDSVPGDPSVGFYIFAVTSFKVQTTSGTYMATAPAADISARNDVGNFADDFLVQLTRDAHGLAGPVVDGLPLVQITVGIGDESKTTLVSDALPLSVPDISPLVGGALNLGFSDGSVFLMVNSDLTSFKTVPAVTPVPAASSFFVICLGVAVIGTGTLLGRTSTADSGAQVS